MPQTELDIVAFVMAEVLSQIPQQGLKPLLNACLGLEQRLTLSEIDLVADYMNHNHRLNGIKAFTENYPERPAGARIIPPNAVVRVGLGFVSSALAPIWILTPLYEANAAVDGIPTGALFDPPSLSPPPANFVDELVVKIDRSPQSLRDLTTFVLALRDAMSAPDFRPLAREYQASFRGHPERIDSQKEVIWNHLTSKLVSLSHLTNYQVLLNFFRHMILR